MNRSFLSSQIVFGGLMLLMTASALLGQKSPATNVGELLDSRLKGKILSLRVPHPEPSLRFDSAGQLISKASHGTNTLDRDIIPKRFEIHDGVLRIKALRAWYLWDAKQKAIARSKNSEEVEIDLELPPGAVSEDSAMAALSGVFLSGQEIRSRACSAEEIVQLRKLMAASAETKPLTKDEMKRLKEEAKQRESQSDSEPQQNRSGVCFPSGERSRSVTKGVKPPKAISTPDPVYTNAARKARIEGAALYLVRIDEHGLPTDILLLKGIEPALNLSGAQALRRWKFVPASFQDESIPVTINVEINFRLY